MLEAEQKAGRRRGYTGPATFRSMLAMNAPAPTAADVAVVIATYNRGERLGPTLQSVLAQTMAPGSIVVVDDGSTDDTAAWTRSTYPQATVLTKANGGTSSARNVGVAHVREPLVLFLDHDDILLPHALETLLAGLAAFPEAAGSFADHSYHNLVSGESYPDHHTAQPAFHRLRQVHALGEREGVRLYGRALFYALLRGNLLQQPWLARREAFLAAGGYAEDVRYCEDWDLYVRLVRRHRVALSDRVISRHIIEGENLHLSPVQSGMHVRVIERLRADAWRSGDLRAALILTRRLALYFKAWGDTAAEVREARRWYRRSALAWPFDMVASARALGALPIPPRPHASRDVPPASDHDA
jgi:glycosyltransferase involved in cell wall biosynthesis